MTGRLSFRPLTPELVADLPPVSAEGVSLGASVAEAAAQMCVPDFAWAGFVGGRLVGAAGLIPCRPGTLLAWAFLDRALPRARVRQVAVYARAIMDLAHAKGYRRIECTVRADLRPGLRFARLLGFKAEGIAEAWASAEVDGINFGRVKAGVA